MHPLGAIAKSLLWALLMLACAALPATAQQVRPTVDYHLIPQQPVETGDRIEVIEFFFYGCPYCDELSPHLTRWQKRQPADVALRRIPVARHDSWVPLAKTFYTLEAMGEVERLHAAVYRSFHVEDLSMSQEKVISEWAGKHGLDRDKFMTIYRSEETRQKVERARKLTSDYGIQGTPTVVVDGRFLTSTGMTPSVAEVIPVIDALVVLARQQRLQKNK